MFRTLQLASAATLFAMTGATASEIAAKSAPAIPTTYEKSFNIFFPADETSLTPEGKTIISTAADRFTSDRGVDQRVFIVSSTQARRSDDLSALRANAVKNELEHDGIRAEMISSIQHSQALPTSLRAWQARRIIVAFGSSNRFAKAGD